MIAQSILDTIGATPLFEFTSEQYPMPEGTKIYAKLEYLNPGGSVKDRLGVHLLKEAMKTGKIKPQQLLNRQRGIQGLDLH